MVKKLSKSLKSKTRRIPDLSGGHINDDGVPLPYTVAQETGKLLVQLREMLESPAKRAQLVREAAKVELEERLQAAVEEQKDRAFLALFLPDTKVKFGEITKAAERYGKSKPVLLMTQSQSKVMCWVMVPE